MPAEYLTIRNATLADCDEMGRLHVRAWREGYAGVMPADYLAALDAAERSAMWRRQVTDTGSAQVLVAELAGRVIGHIAFGSTDTAQGGIEQVGELYSLNLDPDHWGRGVGRVLLRRATDALRAIGCAEAVLWVARDNPRARRLYESDGWCLDGASSVEVFGDGEVALLCYRAALTR